MRKTPLTLMILLAFAAGPVAAHTGHDDCATRTNREIDSFHLDSGTSGCRGVLLTNPGGYCPGTDVHPTAEVHVILLDEGDCDTGVMVEGLLV